jgi:serine/threonine protein kinase
MSDLQTGGLAPTRFYPQPGSFVLPGYRLITQLGRGGFGEVWKAVGPGEVPLAMKLVRLDGPKAALEARSLDFMKFIKHPQLIAIFGIWNQEDFLIIGMELAERTLQQRLCEVTQQGAMIPVRELQGYMAEAAKAIDFLNEPRHTIDGKAGVSIIHRDIKPHNLLLMGNGLKVADFGLARTFEQHLSTKTYALTPAYAAPEFFEGHAFTQSDQYSLAISYYQLRTGALPFQGDLHQLIAGHLNQPPDLSLLPKPEREILRRALAKRPQDRWTNCREFIQKVADAIASGAAGSGAITEIWAEAPRAATPDISLAPDLEIIAVHTTQKDELDVTLRNIGNEPAVIHEITITLLAQDLQLSLTHGPIEPSARYDMDIEDLRVGQSRSFPVSHCVEPHGVDRFTIAVHITDRALLHLTLHYNKGQRAEADVGIGRDRRVHSPEEKRARQKGAAEAKAKAAEEKKARDARDPSCVRAPPLDPTKPRHSQFFYYKCPFCSHIEKIGLWYPTKTCSKCGKLGRIIRVEGAGPIITADAPARNTEASHHKWWHFWK